MNNPLTPAQGLISRKSNARGSTAGHAMIVLQGCLLLLLQAGWNTLSIHNQRLTVDGRLEGPTADSVAERRPHLESSRQRHQCICVGLRNASWDSCHDSRSHRARRSADPILHRRPRCKISRLGRLAPPFFSHYTTGSQGWRKALNGTGCPKCSSTSLACACFTAFTRMSIRSSSSATRISLFRS